MKHLCTISYRGIKQNYNNIPQSNCLIILSENILSFIYLSLLKSFHVLIYKNANTFYSIL